MKSITAQSKKHQNSRLSESIDMDPYSTSIIEELLAVKNVLKQSPEWKSQQEITQLTFRALADLIQVHSESIKDMKSLITTRASKQELTATIGLKANVSDLSKMFDDIASVLQSKVSFDDMNSILKDYAQKKHLHEILVTQKEENQRSDRHGKDGKDFQIKVMQARIDQFQKEMSKRLGVCVTLPEFQQLISIVEQKVNVSQMNEVLENRVTKQYLSTCLQKKISKTDLQNAICKKADAADLDFIINSLEMKASLPTIEKLTQIIENKADRSDLLVLTHEKKSFNEQMIQKMGIYKKQMDFALNEIKKQVQHSKTLLKEQVKIIQRQNQSFARNFATPNDVHMVSNQVKKQVFDEIKKLKDGVEGIEKERSNLLKYDNFKRELTNELNLRKRSQQKIYEQIDDVRKRIQQVAGKALQKTQFFNFKSELAEELDQKIETEHVQEAFNKWEVDITQKMEEDKSEFYNMLQRVQKTLTDSITQNSTDILNMSSALGKRSEKVDQGIVEDIIRKNRRQIEQFRKTIDMSYGQLKGKIDISEYEADLLEIRKKFDQLERQINLKAFIKDVCILADSKPNIEDVNKALKEIKVALDSKTSEDDLQDVVKDQSIINQTLLCQNIVGRWLWQSGEVKAGGLVPWEVQFANTVPDYYFWDKDRSSILILVSGIYEITVSVFGRNSCPTLMVNGDSINYKQQQNMNGINMSRKNSNVKRKKEREMVGVKIHEFITLPSRSRVSVCVSQEGSQGFLNIRRL